MGFLRVHWNDHYITYTRKVLLPLVLAVVCGLKWGPCWLLSLWCAGLHLISPRPPHINTAHQYNKGKGSSKVWKLVTQKPFSKWTKDMLGWLKQRMSFQLPVPAIQIKVYVKMPVSAWCYIPISLPQEQQAAKTKMLLVVRIQQKEYLVLCTVTSRLFIVYLVPNQYKYCLLLSIKNRHKKNWLYNN